MVIVCRRGEAVQTNVANESAAIIDVWCTSRGYRAPPRRGSATQRCERICCYSLCLVHIAWLSGAAAARQCTRHANLVRGASEVLFRRRRGAARHPSWAHEFGAIINVLCRWRVFARYRGRACERIRCYTWHSVQVRCYSAASAAPHDLTRNR